MAKGFLGASGYKAYLGNIKLKKGYIGDRRVYSAGNVVTYNVSPGVSYQEEVDSDASVLSPTSFTPSLSGWTFVGWRTDTAASGSVLTSKTMGDDPITLYAVFRQTVTVIFYNGSTKATSSVGYRYYNNGNTVHPSFAPQQAALSGWTARGWSTGTAGNSGIYSNNGATFTISSGTSLTLYGMYYQTITLSYTGNGATSGSTAAQYGTRYYNSNGNVVNPSVSLRTNGFGKTNYYFTAWAIGSASGTQYAPGRTVALSQNTVFYACWHINMYTITYRYNGTVVATSSVAHGTLVSNYTPPAVSGKTFLGWSTSSTGTTPQTIYATGNMTLYGIGRPTSAPVSGTPYKTLYCGWEHDDDTEASFNLTVPAGGVTVKFTGKYRRGNGWLQVGANGTWSGIVNVNRDTSGSVQVSLQTTGTLNITVRADRYKYSSDQESWQQVLYGETVQVYCAGDATG